MLPILFAINDYTSCSACPFRRSRLSLSSHGSFRSHAVWSRHAQVLRMRGGGFANKERILDQFHNKTELTRPIIEIMKDISSGGDFCAGGMAELPFPGLCIQGVGQVAFPLLVGQAVGIKSIASQAPYGRGPDTVIDLAVRNTLQIDPSKITFSNPKWEGAFNGLVRAACDKMGLSAEETKTELYKVLLYEEGGHFKPHTDAEKADGMFGTLVLQFPCQYEGGSFIVQHSGVQREFKMGADDGSYKFSYQYVAHFADCRHEVKPITSGHRLVAVYSMCMKNGTVALSAPVMENAVRLAKELPKIGDNCFGLLMMHLYTSKSVSKYGLGALKGIDQALAGTLTAASNIMRDQNPDDELVLKISLLSRIRHEGYRQTKVDIEQVFASDGSDASGDEGNPELKLVYRMKFFNDILNYREDKKQRIRTCNGFSGLEGAARLVESYNFTGPDHETEWYYTSEEFEMFWYEDGEYYTGNEGEASKYSGYVLSFHRKAARAP